MSSHGQDKKASKQKGNNKDNKIVKRKGRGVELSYINGTGCNRIFSMDSKLYAYHIVSNAPFSEFEETIYSSQNDDRNQFFRRRTTRQPHWGHRGPGRSLFANDGGRTGETGGNAEQEKGAIGDTAGNAEEAENNDNERGDIPEGDTRGEPEARNDTTTNDCIIPSQGRHRFFHGERSPWKYISKHTGTSKLHYHIIYVSTNKAWGFNGRFGKTIRTNEHKTSKITCIACLLEYLSPGPFRKTLRDILTADDKASFKCIEHSLGLRVKTKQNEENIVAGSTERRTSIFREQGAAQDEDDDGMVEAAPEANEILHFDGERGGRMELEQIQSNSNVQPGTSVNFGIPNTGRFKEYSTSNNQLVLFLCEHRAFDEGEAQRLLCTTPEGIAVQFIKKFPDRLRTAISISRILVFQELPDERIARCKQLQLKKFPHLITEEAIEKQIGDLKYILSQNYISTKEFANATRDHFYGLTGKKNNLFFMGPPSTGKTMVMESLVRLQFNFERLTGLTPGSPFNFSSLVHSNACFMDECKLTENQFEQWKLLAASQPMTTDVKYKSRHTVEHCRLYTASNFPIELYVNVPEAKDAVDTRTIEFKFIDKVQPSDHTLITAFAWTEFWERYADAHTDDYNVTNL